ncbi:hypothetical protein, partial [Burkholderia cenocepacia]|uniref:hypothetical protein n=1 Tax=Burkholderia cenocepacia TaxID=95486 RepID=UPI00406D1092
MPVKPQLKGNVFAKNESRSGFYYGRLQTHRGVTGRNNMVKVRAIRGGHNRYHEHTFLRLPDTPPD